MLKFITDPIILNSFYQKDVLDWCIIDNNKKSYIISDNNDIKYNRFPGFAFTKSRYAELYYDYIYKNYNQYPTPPRGNLSECCEYVFIGIKPGTKDSDLSKSESAWLFGPTPKILNDLLIKFNIYPYFTNLQMKVQESSLL